MKKFNVYISDQRTVTNLYSIEAESLEAVNNMTALDIMANADFIEWVGDSEEDCASTIVDEIEEVDK